MARPKKETVDYFPHTCVHGKTLYILEQKYGNDGYAFWFKLLEILGSSKGHYLNLSEEATYVFLQAKTRTNEELCSEMLDLLCKLGAIDIELWKQKKIIWCQNFVDGIADVYKNRRIETPEKPNFSFYKEKPSKDAVSTADNPQTKLKESKVDNISNSNKSNKYDPIPMQIEDFTDNEELRETLTQYIAMREKIRKKLTDYAFYLILRKLSRLSANAQTQIEILNQSITNSWQDIFALKTDNSFYQKRKKEKQVPDWYGDYEKQLENLPKEDEKEMNQEDIDKILEEAKKMN